MTVFGARNEAECVLFNCINRRSCVPSLIVKRVVLASQDVFPLLGHTSFMQFYFTLSILHMMKISLKVIKAHFNYVFHDML